MLKASSKAISRAFSAFSAASGGRSTPGTVAVMRQVADAGGLKIDVATYPDALIDRDVIKKNLSAGVVSRGLRRGNQSPSAHRSRRFGGALAEGRGVGHVSLTEAHNAKILSPRASTPSWQRS